VTRRYKTPCARCPEVREQLPFIHLPGPRQPLPLHASSWDRRVCQLPPWPCFQTILPIPSSGARAILGSAGVPTAALALAYKQSSPALPQVRAPSWDRRVCQLPPWPWLRNNPPLLFLRCEMVESLTRFLVSVRAALRASASCASPVVASRSRISARAAYFPRGRCGSVGRVS
jgi:hypothetical protein